MVKYAAYLTYFFEKFELFVYMYEEKVSTYLCRHVDLWELSFSNLFFPKTLDISS
jgi:hypothetical protein